MPRVKQLCNCNDRHEANAFEGPQKRPVAEWVCPTHGNVYAERPGGITLTECEEDVLRAISAERSAGRSPTADGISRLTNRSIASCERAMARLRAINFIEPVTPARETGETK